MVDNPKWNPLDHPKDALGKWAKKGAGTYLWGLTKKAIFTSYGGGGVVPAFGQGVEVNIDLDPGDVVYRTPKGNFLVRKVDGTLAMHHWDTSKGYPAVSYAPSSAGYSAMKKLQSTSTFETKQAYLPVLGVVDEVEAQEVLDALAVAKTKPYGKQPGGTVETVQDLTPYSVGTYFAARPAAGELEVPDHFVVKMDDGLYASIDVQSGDLFSASLSEAEVLEGFGELRAVVQPSGVTSVEGSLKDENTAWDTLVSGEQITEISDLSFAPIGAQFKVAPHNGAWSGTVYTKVEGGGWQSSPGGKKFQASDFDAATDPKSVNGLFAVVQSESGTWDALKTDDAVDSVQMLEDAPVGARVMLQGGFGDKDTFTKKSDGKWHDDSGPGSTPYESGNFGSVFQSGSSVSLTVLKDAPQPVKASGPVKASMLKHAPVGTSIKSVGMDNKDWGITYTKTKQGWWQSSNKSDTTPYSMTAVADGAYAWVDPQAAPKPVESVQALKDAPVGASFITKVGDTWTKQANGKWQVTSQTGTDSHWKAGAWNELTENFEAVVAAGNAQWVIEPEATKPYHLPEVGQLVQSVEQLGYAPSGSVIEHDTGALWLKKDNGKWVTGNYATGAEHPAGDLAAGIAAGNFTVSNPVVKMDAPPTPKKYPLLVATQESMASAPTGAAFFIVNVPDRVFAKGSDGNFYRVNGWDGSSKAANATAYTTGQFQGKHGAYEWLTAANAPMVEGPENMEAAPVGSIISLNGHLYTKSSKEGGGWQSYSASLYYPDDFMWDGSDAQPRWSSSVEVAAPGDGAGGADGSEQGGQAIVHNGYTLTPLKSGKVLITNEAQGEHITTPGASLEMVATWVDDHLDVLSVGDWDQTPPLWSKPIDQVYGVGQLLTQSQLESAPEGMVITISTYGSNYEKQPDGTWKVVKNPSGVMGQLFYSDEFKSATAQQNVKVVSAPLAEWEQELLDAAPAVPEKAVMPWDVQKAGSGLMVMTVAELDAAPTGSRIADDDYKYTKQADGTWQSLTVNYESKEFAPNIGNNLSWQPAKGVLEPKKEKPTLGWLEQSPVGTQIALKGAAAGATPVIYTKQDSGEWKTPAYSSFHASSAFSTAIANGQVTIEHEVAPEAPVDGAKVSNVPSLDAAPEGTVITAMDFSWVKQADGWHKQDGTKASPHPDGKVFAGLVANAKLVWGGSEPEPELYTWDVGDAVASVAELETAPQGTWVQDGNGYWERVGSSIVLKYNTQGEALDSDSWVYEEVLYLEDNYEAGDFEFAEDPGKKAPAKPQKGSVSPVVVEGGLAPGYKPKSVAELDDAPVGTAVSHPVTGMYVKQEGGLWQNENSMHPVKSSKLDKAVAGGKLVVVKQEVPLPDDIEESLVAGQYTFTHPTGSVVAVGAGEKLYQHKKVTTSYLLVDSDGAHAEKIAKNGKVMKGDSQLPHIDNYDLYFDAGDPGEGTVAAVATPQVAKKAAPKKKAGAKKKAAPKKKASKKKQAQTVEYTDPDTGASVKVPPGYTVWNYGGNLYVLNQAKVGWVYPEGLSTATTPQAQKFAYTTQYAQKMLTNKFVMPSVGEWDAPDIPLAGFADASAKGMNLTAWFKNAFGVSWNGNAIYHSPEQVLASLTSEEFAEKFKEMHDLLKQAEIDVKPGLDTAKKSKLTKAVQSVELMMLVSSLVRQVEAGDLSVSDAKAQWELIQGKFIPTTFSNGIFHKPVKPSVFTQHINKFFQDQGFTEALETSGYNVKKASIQDSLAMLEKSSDTPDGLKSVMAALNSDELIMAVRIVYGDPALTGNSAQYMQKLEKAGQYRLAKGLAAAEAAKLHTPGVPDAAVDASIEGVQGLPVYVTYTGKEGSPYSVFYKGSGEYAVLKPDGTSHMMTAETFGEVLDALKEGSSGITDLVISEKKVGEASDVEKFNAAKVAELPGLLKEYSTHTILNGAINGDANSILTLESASLDAMYITSVDDGSTTKKALSAYFALGKWQQDAMLMALVDMTAKWKAYKVKHGDGSWDDPDSLAPKSAWLALLGKMHETSWGQKILAGQQDNLSDQELLEAGDYLGLDSIVVGGTPDEPTMGGLAGAQAKADLHTSNFLTWAQPVLMAANEDLAHYFSPGAGEPKDSLLQQQIGKDVPKPLGVDQAAWDMAILAVTDSEFAKKIAKDVPKNANAAEHIGSWDVAFVDTLLLDPQVLNAIVWASTNMAGLEGDDLTNAQQLKKGLTALAKSGYFYTKQAAYFQPPNWTENITVPPGGTVHIESDGTVWLAIDGTPSTYFQVIQQGYSTKSVQYVASGQSGFDYAVQNYQLKPVFTAGKKLTVEDALSEMNTSLTTQQVQAAWDDIESHEWLEWGDFDYPVTQTVAEEVTPFEFKFAVKGNFGEKEFAADYPFLWSHYPQLPPGVKKEALNAASSSDAATLEVLEYKGSKGEYSVSMAFSKVAPEALYAEKIKKNLVTPDDLIDWTPEQISAYGKDYGIDSPTPMAVAMHIQQQKYQFEQQTTNAPKKVLTGELKLTKTNKHLDGIHTKSVWADQVGDEWMVKAFNNDPNGPARVDAEDQSNKIGRLFGFHQPETTTQNIEGLYSYAQFLAPGTQDLVGKNAQQVLDALGEDVLIQVMSEHVLDWVISNHDTHEKHFVISPDKKTVIGIDKGQAFKLFPSDKLARGYRPEGNGDWVWYDRFYDALVEGKISKEVADRVTRGVLQRAWRVQTRNDKEYRELLEKAHAKRTNFPAKYPTREKFIDALMERKANTFADFVKLYEGLYKQSPYTFDIDVEALKSAKVGEAHTSVSGEFVGSVSEAGVHGTSLMFGGKEVEDGHILFYTSQAADGTTTLRGDAKLMKDADATVHDWLKKQTVANVSPAQTPSTPPPPPTPNHAVLPTLDNRFAVLKSYAMTVNHHADDKEYNTSTVEQAQNTYPVLKGQVEAVQAHLKSGSTKLYADDPALKFYTHEQQEAWLDAATTMVSQFEMVNEAHEKQVKIQSLYPGQIPFVLESYTPSPDLSTDGTADVLETWELEGVEYQAWSDGAHWKMTPTYTEGTELPTGLTAEYLTKSEWGAAMTEVKQSGGTKVETPTTTDSPVNEGSPAKYVITPKDANAAEVLKAFPNGELVITQQPDGNWLKPPYPGNEPDESDIIGPEDVQDYVDQWYSLTDGFEPTYYPAVEAPDAPKVDTWVLTKAGYPDTVIKNDGADGLWSINDPAYDDGDGHPGKVLPSNVPSLVEAYATEGWNQEFTANESDETSATVQAGAKKVTVYHRKAVTVKGNLSVETGQLIETGEHSSLQTGQQFDIEFDGVTIHYKPWKEPGVEKAQQGQLRFSVRDWNGEQSQIEEVLSVLRNIGLELPEGGAQQMELLYWRHMYGILQNRNDRTEAKWMKVRNSWEESIAAHPKGMDPETELSAWREAWGAAMGKEVVDAVVAEERYVPQFATVRVQDAETKHGKPFWLRPDMDLSTVRKTQKVQWHHIHNSSGGGGPAAIVRSGGLLATEERYRMLGVSVQGMSSGSDPGYGSSGYIFTRASNRSGYVPDQDVVVLEPHVALRTSNYSFSGDEFGNISLRESKSPFGKVLPFSTPANQNAGAETMVKNSISVMDDVMLMVMSQSERSTVLDFLKKMGVLEIRGVPIEERFVTPGKASTALQKLMDKAEAEAKAEKAAKN